MSTIIIGRHKLVMMMVSFITLTLLACVNDVTASSLNIRGVAGGNNLTSNTTRAVPNIMDILTEKIALLSRKCLLTMKGLDCHGTENDKILKSSLLSRSSSAEQLPIIAGVGFSKMDRSIKPQILISPQGVRISGTESINMQVNGAAEYFGMLYPKDGSPIFNGVYSHGTTSTDLVFSQYFEGDFIAMDQQNQYFTHNVELSTIQVTPEFQQIIDLLPEQLDESLYKLVITSFGESIATKVKYGGVVDLTVSVRSCFSDPQMKQYLETQLQLAIRDNKDTSSLPSGYMRYHKIASLDIVGGNPQIQSVQQRIDTFPSNPVPVRLELTPIWRAFPAGIKQENMKKMYNQVMESMNTEIANKVSDLTSKKLADKLKPQPIYAYKSDRSNGLVSRMGSEIQVAAGASGVIPESVLVQLWRHAIKFNVQKKVYTGFLEMTPVVHRNGDGTFFFDFNYGNCDLGARCKRPGVCEVPRLKITSSVGKDQCIKVHFPNEVPLGDMWVCSGCMPVISANFRDVSCQCPYVN